MGDRHALSWKAAPIVAKLSAVPGGKPWLEILADAEKLANASAARGVGSVGFRTAGAKKMLMEHVVVLLNHHGLLLTSTNCVLLDGATEVVMDAAPPAE